MNVAATSPADASAVNYKLVRELARHRAISPDLVFRRLKAIGVILGLSIAGIAVSLTLLGFDVPVSEPARQLTAFGFVAAMVAMFSALLSASILLWGAFVSQYVSRLDEKAEAVESFDEVEEQIDQATPTKANEELVQTVAQEVVVIATAVADEADEPRAAEGRQVLAELRAAVERLENLQRTLNTGEQQRVLDSLRPRIVIMKQIQLRQAASVEKSSAEEVQTPVAG